MPVAVSVAVPVAVPVVVPVAVPVAVRVAVPSSSKKCERGSVRLRDSVR